MTKRLIIVDRKNQWNLEFQGVTVLEPTEYLTNPIFHHPQSYRVYNLCKSYRYLSEGYYVSLLAEARGHRPMPSVSTMMDMKSRSLIRFVSEELYEIIQKSLKSIKSDHFELSVYFGLNLTTKYDKLSRILFDFFPTPFSKATFEKKEDRWHLRGIKPLTTLEIPESHLEFLKAAVDTYFKKKQINRKKTTQKTYDLAILVNPNESPPPSNKAALQKFVRAGQKLGFSVDLLEPDDLPRLPVYDALFIRETTAVNHHTYQFARRAEAEGLVVLDDPQSILKCCNKVYLSEALTQNQIASPKTLILTEATAKKMRDEIFLPCILKVPDSSFSQGVIKVETVEEFDRTIEPIFKKTDLLVAQEFLPTEFDWRVGILEGEVLFVCRYFMAEKHWQVIHNLGDKKREYGKADSIPVNKAPKGLIRTALAAAELMGHGLYGVDLKEIKGQFYVIEVNDNPNIDAGFEDGMIGDLLYEKIMRYFLDQLEGRGR